MTLTTPVYLPQITPYYFHLLNELDLKTLILLYREYALTRNQGGRVIINPSVYCDRIGCDLDELRQTLKRLEALELAWLDCDNRKLWRVRVAPMKSPRYIPDNPPFISSREREKLKNDTA